MARTTASRWTENDIPSQEGRIAVITGANSGLGLQTARALAARGAHVVLAVRNLDKGRRAVAEIADRSRGPAQPAAAGPGVPGLGAQGRR
ncbi:short chain dehydrogenase [Streptomyces gancidicus BKS 13-15]|uniref:Short chain dehydrogenase n=1 Tax=Streptomyces gancidicus BKS 13-15 TaxID=1284664 RepID=M3DP61_STREZ|nr:short chain dehydrogenase [Streptomyces gancidicus BKS 13-15]